MEYWGEIYKSNDDKIEEAKTIWKLYNNRKYNDSNFAKLDDEDRLVQYQHKYKKFHKHFPITLRYMIAYNLFYEKIFKRYVGKLEKQPPKSMDEKFERDATYVSNLYRHNMKKINRHYSASDIAELRTEIYEALKKEKEDFEKKHKQDQKEINRCIKLNDAQKKKMVVDYLQKQMKIRKKEEEI